MGCGAMQLSSLQPGPLVHSRQQAVPVKHGRRAGITNAVKDVFMPALSSTMTEGKITTWLKAPGDKVGAGISAAASTGGL